MDDRRGRPGSALNAAMPGCTDAAVKHLREQGRPVTDLREITTWRWTPRRRPSPTASPFGGAPRRPGRVLANGQVAYVRCDTLAWWS
ncbi:hypothetical protein [Nonomuraea dietziae]|uniref:Uncharacterized protein n=1 Tax=Nonomuraea dietziae TaxID=65515 RepID=A0A7W5YAH1_9ACTN|nr:hypothetical protein [Nonomuraea dietziae]MBB3726983.1 hypothetical protein [Nonomuraea dietziae]